jgi:phosphatidylglycerophosphate synthase
MCLRLDVARPRLSSMMLADVIAGARVGTQPLSYYRTVLYRSFTAPLAVFVMLLLALPTAASQPRGRAGSREMLYGLGLGLAFLLVDGMIAALGTSGRLPPLTTALAAPLLFGAIGLLRCAITNAYEALDRHLLSRARLRAIRPGAARAPAPQCRQGERGRAGGAFGPGREVEQLARGRDRRRRRPARCAVAQGPGARRRPGRDRRRQRHRSSPDRLSPEERPAALASRGEGGQRAVALRLDPAQAEAIPADAADLAAVADALVAAGRIAPVDEAAFPAYVDKLRRSLPYWLHSVTDAATRKRLERQMFWENYKGSTDLLTRWVYPPIVWPLVLMCTHLRIHPNVITGVSIAFTIAAVPPFAEGHWLLGFFCAYAMSVLDSVDGKVARLTLTDSKIGNLLDHGIDQVHPPFWYFAWAWGLGARTPADPLYQAAILLILFYLADRIVLAAAKRRLGFALHAATRLDGQVRSYIARRNITMTIMAFALLLGQGAAGFWIVTAWQGLTFAWHAARTIWLGSFRAARARRPDERVWRRSR